MMAVLFYVAAAVTIAAAIMAMTRSNAAHGLIFLIVTLLGIAVLFFLLGAPFAAALEIVVYAGAIMVLFVFVIMMLNLGEKARAKEQSLLAFRYWLMPAVMAGILLVELLLVFNRGVNPLAIETVTPKAVALSLFGPYVLGVELASMLLLAGLVGAYHLGRDFLSKNRGRPQ